MILQVEINNFRSFKHDLIDKFSEQTNLILGLNGHGKSNFYQAIKYCLTLEDKDTVTEEQKKNFINVK